jgi:hypothetical protein
MLTRGPVVMEREQPKKSPLEGGLNLFSWRRIEETV